MNEKKKNVFSTIIVSLMAVIFMLVSILVLFVPQVEVKDICYFCCGLIVVIGIYMIVRYFMTAGYERLNEYGFSEGVLFVLLGICGLVSAESMAKAFLTVLGLALLLSGVIKLQYALDLKCMNDHLWIAFFVVTLILLGGSVSVILNPFSDEVFYQNYTCYVLLVDGVVEIINILYLNFRTKAYQKRGAGEEDTKNGKEKVAEKKEDFLELQGKEDKKNSEADKEEAAVDVLENTDKGINE